MANRFDLRARYIDGWYEMDAEKLLSSTRADFRFDDPREAAPVTRDGLRDYMVRWQRRAGNMNEWILRNEVREDRDGILTDWHWWHVVGTELRGAAVITTSDDGVFLERIAYFERASTR